MSEHQQGGAAYGAQGTNGQTAYGAQNTHGPNTYYQPPQKRFMPNGFVNFLISFIPGAGHMYQGLLSRGALLMIAISVCVMGTALFGNLRMGALSSIFVGVFIAAMVVLYFFAFFESMKTCRMIRMGLTESEELKLSGLDLSGINISNVLGMRKGVIALGVIMTVLGVVSTANILADRYLDRYILQQYVWPAMELLIPLAFLVIGVVLILKGRRAIKAG